MFYFTGGKMKQKELYKTAVYCRLSLAVIYWIYKFVTTSDPSSVPGLQPSY